MKALWRTVLTLFVATAFARQDHAGRLRAEMIAPGNDEHDGTDLGDDFAYDVAARFNEVLIANIDATDNALIAMFAGTLALGAFAVDKIGELAPERARIVLALFGASALAILLLLAGAGVLTIARVHGKVIS